MRVELHGVRKSHTLPGGGFVTVLAGVDLTLESGTATLIRGASGSGKTTLLDIMGGLARPSSGSVRLDGTELRRCGAHRGTIARAFQPPVFIPELTVMENLMAPAIRCRETVPPGRGESLLELFGLGESFDLFPDDLSGGERQRLNLARALLPTPRLLLLDDPFTGLDEEWEKMAGGLVMRQWRESGATLVITGSRPAPCREEFRQLRLHKGKVITDDSSDC